MSFEENLTWDDLEDYVFERSTQKDDHVLWKNMCPTTNKLRPCRIVNFAKSLNLPKTNYYPQELMWMLNDNELKGDARLIPTCEFPNCILHFEQLQYNLTSVREMDAYDYVTKCIQFEKLCAPQDPITKCINWTGYVHTNGYGQCSFLNKRKHAHMVAWELASMQDIADGLIIRHHCPEKNKLCVNENHLEIGTPAQNSQDEVEGGFTQRGSKHANVKISEDTARLIIASWHNGQTRKQKSIEFGVSVDIIQSIDKAASWKHLMTEKQIIERRSKPRKKKVQLTSNDIRTIKNSTEAIRTCAKRFKVNDVTVKRIRDGTYSKFKTKKKIYDYDEVIMRIAQRSTVFLDLQTKIEHLLFDDDRCQDSKKVIQKVISYFGKLEGIAKASFLAHNKLLTIGDGLLIRHKCLYKYCVAIGCLETGTNYDNAKDKLRDGTLLFGEKGPGAKITELVAKQIKQTKGVVTQNVRCLFFKVKKSTIKAIDCGATWKHLEDEIPDSILLEELNEFVQKQNMEKKLLS